MSVSYTHLDVYKRQPFSCMHISFLLLVLFVDIRALRAVQMCIRDSLEGDKVKLFELIYFQKHAPKEVLEHWNIRCV